MQPKGRNSNFVYVTMGNRTTTSLSYILFRYGRPVCWYMCVCVWVRWEAQSEWNVTEEYVGKINGKVQASVHNKINRPKMDICPLRRDIKWLDVSLILYSYISRSTDSFPIVFRIFTIRCNAIHDNGPETVIIPPARRECIATRCPVPMHIILTCALCIVCILLWHCCCHLR